MRAPWQVSSVRENRNLQPQHRHKRLANLLDWLGNAVPDVVCLQVLKAETRAFLREVIEEAGYHALSLEL
jgi:exonuclease III